MTQKCLTESTARNASTLLYHPLASLTLRISSVSRLFFFNTHCSSASFATYPLFYYDAYKLIGMFQNVFYHIPHLLTLFVPSRSGSRIWSGGGGYQNMYKHVYILPCLMFILQNIFNSPVAYHDS